MVIEFFVNVVVVFLSVLLLLLTWKVLVTRAALQESIFIFTFFGCLSYLDAVTNCFAHFFTPKRTQFFAFFTSWGQQGWISSQCSTLEWDLTEPRMERVGNPVIMWLPTGIKVKSFHHFFVLFFKTSHQRNLPQWHLLGPEQRFASVDSCRLSAWLQREETGFAWLWTKLRARV